MEKFNYFNNFILLEICDSKDDDLLFRLVKEAHLLEDYFSEFTDEIDSVRELILISYKLNLNIDFENRKNYIRGIVYSKHYIDTKDLSEFEESLKLYNLYFKNNNSTMFKYYEHYEEIEMYTFEQTLDFQECPPETVFDIEMFGEYHDEDSIDSIKGGNTSIKYQDDDDDSEENNDDNDDNEDVEKISIEDMSEDMINMLNKYNPDTLISPDIKLEFFKDNFDKYLDIIIKRKNVKENDKEYVIKGMNDWFNRMFSCMSFLVKKYNDDLIRHDETLFKAL